MPILGFCLNRGETVITKTSEVSEPRSFVLKEWYRSASWQAPRQRCYRAACQLSERSGNSRCISRIIEISRDAVSYLGDQRPRLAVRWLVDDWAVGQLIRTLLAGHKVTMSHGLGAPHSGISGIRGFVGQLYRGLSGNRSLCTQSTNPYPAADLIDDIFPYNSW